MSDTTATATSTIERDDTVRLIGRKGRGIVVDLDATRVMIEYTFNVRRYGQGKGCTMRASWYPRERVELVRKGNAELDAVTEMLALCDTWDAKSAAAAGLTLDEWRARQDAERAAEAARLARESAAFDAAKAAHRAAQDAAAARAAHQAMLDEAHAEAELIHMEIHAVEGAAHTALHGGDFFEALLCGVAGECPHAG